MGEQERYEGYLDQLRAENELLKQQVGAQGVVIDHLRSEREQMGAIPFESAFLVYGEPEQLIFRGPNGQVLLQRVHADRAEQAKVAERILERAEQVEAQAGEIAELRAGKELLRNEVAEFQNLRANVVDALDTLIVEASDNFECDHTVGLLDTVQRHIEQLRAALGAADEPTTGGGDPTATDPIDYDDLSPE